MEKLDNIESGIQQPERVDIYKRIPTGPRGWTNLDINMGHSPTGTQGAWGTATHTGGLPTSIQSAQRELTWVRL